jgi:hypothetical protein
MKDKYKIVMVVDGVDLFHTVMKVVENNKGITVINRELLADEAPPPKRTRHRVATGRRPNSMHAEFMVHAERATKDNVMTLDQIGAWLVSTGRSAASASSMASRLVAEKKLVRIAPKTYRLP